MHRMVRKQVYIESRQETTLKQQAKALGISEEEIIRRAIDRQMLSVRFSAKEKKAWEREKAFITKRMAKSPLTGSRQWRREEAYEERLTR